MFLQKKFKLLRRQAADSLVSPWLQEGSSKIPPRPQLSRSKRHFSSSVKATVPSRFPYSWQMAEGRSAETAHLGGITELKNGLHSNTNKTSVVFKNIYIYIKIRLGRTRSDLLPRMPRRFRITLERARLKTSNENKSLEIKTAPLLCPPSQVYGPYFSAKSLLSE